MGKEKGKKVEKKHVDPRNWVSVASSHKSDSIIQESQRHVLPLVQVLMREVQSLKNANQELKKSFDMEREYNAKSREHIQENLTSLTAQFLTHTYETRKFIQHAFKPGQPVEPEMVHNYLEYLSAEEESIFFLLNNLRRFPEWEEWKADQDQTVEEAHWSESIEDYQPKKVFLKFLLISTKISSSEC